MYSHRMNATATAIPLAIDILAIGVGEEAVSTDFIDAHVVFPPLLLSWVWVLTRLVSYFLTGSVVQSEHALLRIVALQSSLL